ncbi:hypothetical protein OE88DRAFT_1669419 [Heliocybe sulcata]|uniref:F-box domain-containing protein n=1 Tax=Heliocybe sulcata TaxID=5364 RepID=A0A5C3MV60_9AGAM|nr:hypothetical protein OE88DRAFT_1669419 [Heliocybe sulcata]
MLPCSLSPLSHLQSLETLDLASINVDQFQELRAGVRNIRRLSFSVEDVIQDYDFNIKDLFPKLEALTLVHAFVWETTPFINALGTTSLRKLVKLSGGEAVNQKALRGMFSALSPRFAATFTSIRITVDKLRPEPGVLMMHSLEPLLSLVELRSLELYTRAEGGNRDLKLLNDDIRTMVLAWPNIEILVLLLQFTGLTTDSLFEIARHCRHLRELRLWRIRVVELDVDQLPQVSLPSLRIMQIHYHVRSSASTEHYGYTLSRLFPNVNAKRLLLAVAKLRSGTNRRYAG